MENERNKSWIDWIATGAAAGFLAGMGVALTDSVRLWMIGGVDLTLPGYAALLYGPFLALMGVAGAIVLRGLRRWIPRLPSRRVTVGVLLGFALFGVFSFPIGYFYFFRDVFGEKVGVLHPKMLMAMAGLLCGLLMLSVGGAFLVRMAVRRFFGDAPSHKVPVLVATVGVAVMLLGWGAFGGETAKESLLPVSRDNLPNILVVMNDTHRQDYAGPYGNTDGLTPHLDKVAEDGVVYDGYANSSWTRPAVSTILTGRYASSHTAMLKGSILPDEVTTLAEVLLEGGYETIGISTNYNLTPFFNVDQGFHDYKYLPPRLPLWASDEQSKLIFIEIVKKVQARLAGDREVPEDYYVVGEVVTDKALERLETRDRNRPFFMFLSYMDVHDPYFEHPYNGYGISHRRMPNPDPNDAALIEEMKRLYRGEIKYWDRHFGRLIDGLKQRGEYDDTLIFVLSDHGEEFGEHGGFWHGTTLYEEQIKIIYVVKYPQSKNAGVEVSSWYSLVDVAPMILSEVGFDIPDEMQGVPKRRGQRETVFAEEDHQGNILKSVNYQDETGNLRKVIVANEGNPRGVAPVEFFDIHGDPEEMHNLAGEAAAALEKGMTILEDAQKNALKGRAKSQEGELSGDMKKQLQNLGYME